MTGLSQQLLPVILPGFGTGDETQLAYPRVALAETTRRFCPQRCKSAAPAGSFAESEGCPAPPRPSPGTFPRPLPLPGVTRAASPARRAFCGGGRAGVAPRSQRLSGRGCLGPGSTPPRPCPGPAAAALDAHGMEGRPEPPPSCWTAPGAPQPDLRLSFAERSGAHEPARVSPKGPALRGLPFSPRRVLSGQPGATRCTEPRWPCARGGEKPRRPSAPSKPGSLDAAERGVGLPLGRWTPEISWPGEPPGARLNSPAFPEPPRSSRPGHRRRRAVSFLPVGPAAPSPRISTRSFSGCPAAQEKAVPGDRGGRGRGTVLSLGQPRLEGGRLFSFQTCKMSPEPLVPRSGARQLLQPLIGTSRFPSFT